MKYFLDTEFIEGFHKPWFGKRRHFIDLISIGIVAEDGRVYEALSSEYSYKDASQWVKDNVISPLYTSTVPGIKRGVYSIEDFHVFYGKPNAQIAEEIVRFVNPVEGPCFDPYPVSEQYKRKHNTKTFGHILTDPGLYEMAQPEFWGYFSDYDWVLFCSLFGTMMQLPEGFPMYCNDLVQSLTEKARRMYLNGIGGNPEVTLETLQKSAGYPAQENEHSAIADARWNRKLYDFLFSQRQDNV